MKKIRIAVLIIAAIALPIVGYLLFSGPRMHQQLSIHTFERREALPPAGTLPVEASTLSLDAIATMPRPPSTPATIDAGRVYYGYYCLACHGESGLGDGPVGQSYTPTPTDLTSPRVEDMNDATLYVAMLRGRGHEPVLERVVRPPRRWAIVDYVRAINSAPAAPASARQEKGER